MQGGTSSDLVTCSVPPKKKRTDLALLFDDPKNLKNLDLASAFRLSTRRIKSTAHTSSLRRTDWGSGQGVAHLPPRMEVIEGRAMPVLPKAPIREIPAYQPAEKAGAASFSRREKCKKINT